MKDLVDKYFEKEKPKEILYHYCSIEVLLSILKNRSLWLSDLYKSNDKNELSWILSNFMDLFPVIIKEIICELKLEKEINTDNLINQITNGINYYIAAHFIRNKYYAFCFSEEDDLLSQWRGYGDDGNGVAIGFDSNLLMKFQDYTTFDFTKIIYSKKEIEDFLISFLNENLKYIDYTASNVFDYRTEIAMLYQVIAKVGFAFKNPYFGEEREWRLVCNASSMNFHNDDSEDYDDGLTDSFYKEIKGPKFSRSEIKFRTTKNDIISYIEVGFAQVCSKFIKRIVLGPKCNLNEFDLKLLLHSMGYIESFEDKSIEIVRSEVPYI